MTELAPTSNGTDPYATPYDFRAVRRLNDRDLARFVADRERDAIDMTFIDAEWQRRQRRAGLSRPDVALAAVALLVSVAALGVSAYAVLGRPAVAPVQVVDAAADASSPRLAYQLEEPPFPQRRTAR